MKELQAELLSLERLDPDDLLERYPHALRELCALREFPWGDESLLAHTRRTMDAVFEQLPVTAPPAGEEAPWWSPAPAVYIAALFQHAGLPVVTRRTAAPRPRILPHQRTSALICRRVLGRVGIPFTIREHVAALVLHSRKPEGLVGSDSPAETYMRLACRLDLRSLYLLRLAELRAGGVPGRDGAGHRLTSFRDRSEELSVFSAPPRPPVTVDEIEHLSGVDEDRARRMANALRYFRLCQGFTDREWFVDRLRKEARMAQGRLNLLVGIAGCGKSTWTATHMLDAEVVSSDRMRLRISGDESDQSRNYLVFLEAMKRIAAALREGGTVVFDATNYSEELRGKPVATARWAGAKICTYFFDLALTEALERNAKRPRQVPEHVMRRQWRMLTLPALYEADEHYVVDPGGRAERYWPSSS